MRLIDADELIEHAWRDKLDSRELIAKMIDDAPTVKEIPTKIPINVFEQLISHEPKTGHWIMIDKELQRYKCSECGEVIRLYKKSEIPKLEKDETLSNYPFSHCGCRMVESHESEVQE